MALLALADAATLQQKKTALEPLEIAFVMSCVMNLATVVMTYKI